MTYIGIDPSLTGTGMVAILPSGTIDQVVFKTSLRGVARMSAITQAVENFTFRSPSVICIEGFSYGSKGKAVFEMGGLGWILRLRMFLQGLHYFEVAPSQLKKYATGRGNAKKHEVAVAVAKRWGFEAKTEDEIDAFVLAKIAEAIDKGGNLTEFQQGIVDELKGAK